MEQNLRTLVWVADTDLRIHLVNVINRSANYEGIEYRNGAGALEAIYNQRPQLILIDIDYAVTNPELVVREIREHLSSAILIGLSRRWDERKRKQFEELFDGVLVMPFDLDSFERVAEEALNSGKNHKCEVLSFFAPKGKSGRTTLIVNLALGLARASGERVAIIDAETNFADMEAFMNLNPKSTIVEALRDLTFLTPGTLSHYFEEVTPNVHVLCGVKSLQQAKLITPEGLTRLINMAKRSFRYVLIDMASGFNNVTVAACELADHAYLTVMAGGAFEMKHLKRSLEIFQAMDNFNQRVECIITRIQPEVKKRKSLEEELGCPVTLIPNEYLLCAQAANNGRMATDIGPRAALTEQINQMVENIISQSR